MPIPKDARCFRDLGYVFIYPMPLDTTMLQRGDLSDLNQSDLQLDPNPVKSSLLFSSLSDNMLAEWRDRFQQVEKEWLENNVKIVWKIVEGFLLFYDPRVVEHLDVQIFLRSPRYILHQRRLGRTYTHSNGAIWADPPNYWEQIAYPGYVRAHSHLFHEGDIDAEDLSPEARASGLVVLEGQGTKQNLSFEEIFKTAASTVLNMTPALFENVDLRKVHAILFYLVGEARGFYKACKINEGQRSSKIWVGPSKSNECCTLLFEELKSQGKQGVWSCKSPPERRPKFSLSVGLVQPLKLPTQSSSKCRKTLAEADSVVVDQTCGKHLRFVNNIVHDKPGTIGRMVQSQDSASVQSTHLNTQRGAKPFLLSVGGWSSVVLGLVV
ncbi:hypothetical protein BDV93DRAFT_546396 [Ceratobasidium sp. AG-I]|nr:hypothetical protein BDV93DRAFT_546396 [Ceratobasidium sp. AG-I]